MKNIRKFTTLLLATSLTACASWGTPPPLPGETRASVETRLGHPTNVYQLATGPELEYATGPMGQTTVMVRFGPDERVTSSEQVLDAPAYARVKIGVSTELDVLHLLGRPTEKSYLSRQKLHVWSYRYKESGAWDSMMHVHFDDAGIVRMMLNGPDPDRDEKRF